MLADAGASFPNVIYTSTHGYQELLFLMLIKIYKYFMEREVNSMTRLAFPKSVVLSIKYDVKYVIIELSSILLRYLEKGLEKPFIRCSN